MLHCLVKKLKVRYFFRDCYNLEKMHFTSSGIISFNNNKKKMFFSNPKLAEEAPKKQRQKRDKGENKEHSPPWELCTTDVCKNVPEKQKEKKNLFFCFFLFNPFLQSTPPCCRVQEAWIRRLLDECRPRSQYTQKRRKKRQKTKKDQIFLTTLYSNARMKKNPEVK